MITADTLKRFAPRIRQPELHARALEAARQACSVDRPRRLCHFMGQIFVETAGFTVLEENLNYRNPERLDAIFRAVRSTEDAKELIRQGPQAIANRVYARRLGNGDEASGDGWTYRGSGYKQLTGCSNFREIGRLLGLELEENPEWARDPGIAARITFAFWDSRGCSALSDRGDLEGITRQVNGPARLGLAERRAATLKALGIWIR